MRTPLASLAVLLNLAAAQAAIDPAREVIVRWPAGHEVRHVQLLKEAGVTVALLAWPGAPATEPFAKACQAAGIAPVAELAAAQNPDQARALRERARAAGFAGIAVEADAFPDEKALAAFLAERKGLDALVFLKPEQIHWRVAPAHAVLREGQWPGIRRLPDRRSAEDFQVSSASREPWLDANSYLVSFLRAWFPERAALLGYRPDEAAGVKPDRMLPYYSLELALVEAMAAGGNVILSLPERHHAALLAGHAEALAAWRGLASLAAFLRQHGEWFREPPGSSIVVAAGALEQSGEILNMLYRRNASPAVVPVTAIPPLSPGRYRAAAAANVPPPPAGQKRLLDFARAGGLLMTAPAEGASAWWVTRDARQTRAQADRDWYALGKGMLVAYREPVLDPHEFALDVIDAVGIRVRDLRVFTMGTVIGLIKRPAAGRLILVLLNYGSSLRDYIPVRVEGRYRQAALYEPASAAPQPLKVAGRASGTEIVINRLGRVAVVILE